MRNALVGEEIKDIIISFGKPYKTVWHDMISSWIKSKLTDARGETPVFRAHPLPK